MGEKTGIEWTRGDDGMEGSTWNPIRGCSKVSEGCRNCYAMRVAATRMSGPGQAYEGLAKMVYRSHTVARPVGHWTQVKEVIEPVPMWTGEVRFIEKHLHDPIKWKRPRRIFVNSMSDLFYEKFSDQDIERVFATMALAHWHTFIVLTKRADRMHDWFNGPRAMNVRGTAYRELGRDPGTYWPLPNVWMGVSVEDQPTANARVPELLATPAAMRLISYEPALGPLELRWKHWLEHVEWDDGYPRPPSGPRLDWVIAGSESGPGARPAEVDWFRQVRDQCQAAGTAFFFKQWVGPTKLDNPALGVSGPVVGGKVSTPELDGRRWVEFPR